MKIAVISTMLGQPWTGSEELWAATVEAALDAGDEVLISLWQWETTPPRVEKLQKRGAKVLFRKRPGGLPTLGGIAARVAGRRVKLPRPLRFSAYRGLFAWQPDVIFLSQGWTYEFRDNPDLVAQLMASKTPLVVVTQANMEEPISHSMRQDLLDFAPRAATIAFVAAGNRRAAERQIAARLPQAVVVRNPVNLRDRSVVAWPASPASGEAIWNLAGVGRFFTGHKGQDVLLEALSDPIWKNRPWKLQFFGSGEERDYLEALIGHFDLAEKVEFGGHVPDVRVIWETHHLLLMPSRVEGTPLALVEAMLCGRAALVTDIAGHREWIEEGVTGFVAEAPSAASLRAALERAWEARPKWRAMGLAAHQVAQAQTDPQAGQTMLEIVKKAAKL